MLKLLDSFSFEFFWLIYRTFNQTRQLMHGDSIGSSISMATFTEICRWGIKPEVTAEGSPTLPTITLTTWLSQNHATPLLLRLRGGKNVIVITTCSLQVVRVVGSAGDLSAVTPGVSFFNSFFKRIL